MELYDFFRSVGGVAGVRALGDPSDPEDITWNFGLAPAPVSCPTIELPSTLYGRFPNLQGRWDGKANICHHNAVRQVLGTDIKPHQQPSGTCGGRAGSRSTELLQCGLIAGGKRAKFHYVSHAWLYYLARREFNMLGGSDGVASGSIPTVLGKYGLLDRDEAGDPEMAGPRSDDQAVAWGSGRLRTAQARELESLAIDNVVTARVRVGSAQELADGLAAGGIGIGSDDRGFTMTRDADGACSPKGVWYHYHTRSGLSVTSRGRRLFVYDQSWGLNVPDGPPVPGFPDNCFGVDWDVQDACCKRGDYEVLFSLDLWDLETGNYDIPWIF